MTDQQLPFTAHNPSLSDEAREICVALEQRVLYDQPRVHARRTDPYTSDQALKAIAKFGKLMYWIWFVAVENRMYGYGRPFNDTQLTEAIELATGQRQQRNVVARSRGMLEDAGMLRQVGVRSYRGRELMHYEIDPNNKKENP